jgi:hypothetical protein
MGCQHGVKRFLRLTLALFIGSFKGGRVNLTVNIPSMPQSDKKQFVLRENKSIDDAVIANAQAKFRSALQSFVGKTIQFST